MDLYTMTQNFLPERPVNNFVSAIWTERFFSAGEVQIVVPAIPEMFELLAGGTFLGLRGTREVMILDTHDIKDGLLTVKGDTLVKFFDERMAWFRDADDPNAVSEYKQEANAGAVLINVLNKTVISPVANLGNQNLDWARDKIENLTLGEMDTGGDAWPRTFPIGSLYSGLESFVKKEGMGFRIYLDSASDTGYALKFMAYRGRDRTSGQNVNPLIRLSPHTDSLSDLKEVLSISEYKNVVYVHYNDRIYTYYAEPTLPIPKGFNRRVMVKETSGIPGPSGETNWLLQQAKDAFANNNYIRAIDGQTSLLSPYKYQKDYRLGDILELEGLTGTLAKARVTEYIRVHDNLGHREYPTISVVDPLDTGNWPALNTYPDYEDQWDDDFFDDFFDNFFDNFGDGFDFGEGIDYPSGPYNPYPGYKTRPSPYPDPDPNYDPDTDPDPDPGSGGGGSGGGGDPPPDPQPQHMQTLSPFYYVGPGNADYPATPTFDDTFFKGYDFYDNPYMPGAGPDFANLNSYFIYSMSNQDGTYKLNGSPSDFAGLNESAVEFKMGAIDVGIGLDYIPESYANGVLGPKGRRGYYWWDPNSPNGTPYASPLYPLNGPLMSAENPYGRPPGANVLVMTWEMIYSFDDSLLNLNPPASGIPQTGEITVWQRDPLRNQADALYWQNHHYSGGLNYQGAVHRWRNP